jgi:hypothetical protein
MNVELVLKCLFAAFLAVFFVVTFEPPKTLTAANKK